MGGALCAGAGEVGALCVGAFCTGALGAGCSGVGVTGAGFVVVESPWLFCVCSRIDPVDGKSPDDLFTDSVSDVIINTIAHHVVARDKNVAAPRGPNAVWLPAPPNAPAKSAADPLCSMITMISTMHTITCSVTNTNENRQPIQISRIATASDNPHFAHDGIPISANPLRISSKIF